MIMCYLFEVEFLVRKGLGPEWLTKFVTIAYDDVDPDVHSDIVKDWAINEAKHYLKTHDCPAFIYQDIHNS